MGNKLLGRVILFGTAVLICLTIVQVYWFKRAFDASEKQFDHTVQIALKKVADSVSRDAEVKKLSSNFFFVATETLLNNEHVDSLLKKEFLMRNLHTDYELGVYNADDDTLVYGAYVSGNRLTVPDDHNARAELSKNEKNFAVYSPKKDSYIVAQLQVWVFSTFILLLMVGFFAYAMYSLLREQKFSALKNDFINNMTHEFKTPVTNIGIAGEILKKKIADANGTGVYIDILLKENEKLRQKIDQVLLGSSMDNLNRPSLDVVDVHQLIIDCADAFQLKIQERNGNIVFDLHAANACILGDRDLLAQAINNVIDNAEKYSPSQPRIVVSTKDHRKGIEIVIADQGVGIQSDLKEKVFEKFYRVRTGDVHDVKGFGLGLSFVKNVVGKHRGRVNLFSELNKGTEVSIILPTYA